MTSYWLGKHRSLITKEKIKNANNGKHYSLDTEFKKGMVPWHKGKKTGIIPANSFKKGHVPWNKGKKGIIHTQQTKEKIRLNSPKYWLGKNLSEETKRKLSVALKGKPGPRRGARVSDESKAKMRLAKLGKPSPRKGAILSAKQIRKMLMFRPFNKSEQKLNRILKQNFPKEWKFVGDGRVVIEGKNPDFININGRKLIIELFGVRWHKEEEIDPRKRLFSKYGYKTLILWDLELKDEEKILQKIKSFIG